MRNILSTSTNGKFFLQARSVGFESGGKGQTQTKILENQKKKKRDRFENHDIPYQECDRGGVVVFFFVNCLIYTSVF